MVTEQKKIANCLLEKREGCCTKEECKKCGWNKANNRRLKKFMQLNGLTKRADGKFQLVVPNSWGKDEK